jgi:hypothetical protein
MLTRLTYIARQVIVDRPDDGCIAETCTLVFINLNTYRVIHKTVKHFKNSQQIDYATDHGDTYTEREGNFPSFLKEKLAHIVVLICR